MVNMLIDNQYTSILNFLYTPNIVTVLYSDLGVVSPWGVDLTWQNDWMFWWNCQYVIAVSDVVGTVIYKVSPNISWGCDYIGNSEHKRLQ